MATKKYVFGDGHLGHGPGILRFRQQFTTPEEHDKFVVDRINETVPPTNTLILVGDMLIREAGLEFLQAIQCRNIIYVPGNHCGERARLNLPERFQVMGAYSCRLPATRIDAVFTHIPVHPDCLDRWDYNIHGHLHDSAIDDKRYFCASAERIDYRPIALEAIVDRLRADAWNDESPWPEWKLNKRIKAPVVPTEEGMK